MDMGDAPSRVVKSGDMSPHSMAASLPTGALPGQAAWRRRRTATLAKAAAAPSAARAEGSGMAV